MVHDDGEGFLGPDEVWSPVGDSFKDGYKFAFVNIVVPFRWCEGC